MTLENMIERLDCLLELKSLEVTFHEDDIQLIYVLLRELKALRVEFVKDSEELEVYKGALFSMAEDFAHAEYILDGLLDINTQRSKAELVHEYVCKARDEV